MKKLLIMLLVTLFAGTTNAAIIDIYDGVGAGDLRSDWEIAVGSFNEEDFSGGLSDFSITTTGSHSVFNMVGDLSDRLTSNNSTIITFNSDVTSFGANWDLSPRGQGLGIQIDVNGILLALEIPRNFTGEFFGFTSDTAFSSIILTSGTQAGIAETYNADNFVYSVPEPATLALLGLGLVGFGVSRKRKQ